METNNENETVIDDPKAVLAALERAKNDAKKFREEKEQLENDLNQKNQTIADYNSRLLKEKLTQKISTEGIKGADRILKYINLEALHLNDEFEVIGLEEQIEKLRTDLPEVFDAKLRVGGQADSAVAASVSTQYSASQLQAMKILGKL